VHEFEITDGSHKGCYYDVVTGCEVVGGCKLGDLIEAMVGRELVEGDAIDPQYDFVGEEFMLLATPTSSTGGRFQSLTRIEKETK